MRYSLISPLLLLVFVAFLTACNHNDSSSSDPAPAACNDGRDNDQDGLTDFPNDPGCVSKSDGDETDPTTPPACADGVDNDSDNLTDFPDDPGCNSASDDDESNPLSENQLNRYHLANHCWVLKAGANEQYVASGNEGYAASAADPADAERFFLKPTALGSYALYDSSRNVVAAVGDGSLTTTTSATAGDNAEWTVLAVGDTTDYPATPAYHQEPTPEQVEAWHGFVDPDIRANAFTLTVQSQNSDLATDDNGNLITVATGNGSDNTNFTFEAAQDCANYPEAQSNFSGTPFKGTQPDGTVLGHADVHVHISATEFLGGAQWGRPFHKFGVEQAIGDCSADHGDNGERDLVNGAFSEDFDGHATDGYPTFSEWPARDMLTHEAIYWKWIERAWASGLRVIVNDLVDNETLCELQRNAVGEPDLDCNSMNNAGRQAGTMYAMENYIDAQYGGPGKGFFQIVHSSSEARDVIEDGKIAVVLGIEISNLFDCKVNYNPARLQRPFEETGEGPNENTYGCTEASVAEQIDRVHAWGVRQIISIHEFDNAFGGNGIFDGAILNLGNRENSGGIPSGDIDEITGLLSMTFDPAAAEQIAGNFETTELATGEYWTTYNCPEETQAPDAGEFSGYLWEDSGGALQFHVEGQTLPACVPTGQEGRHGGPTPCYPSGIPQCNARWMTPLGLFTYKAMMEKGFLLDWDHMELGMKTQMLELAEAQEPVYPFVSTHGTFGGTSVDQATRNLANGGFLYPSNGSSAGFRANMDETFGIYETAMALRAAAGGDPLLFGFGYGTDTNGLSAQTRPRDNPEQPITYPYTLFDGAPFNTMPEFTGVAPISFDQPNSVDVDGNEQQSWHQDEDGNAHYGMLSGFVQEILLDSEDPAAQMRHLFNSAEAYLQTWELTEQSSTAIQANGEARDPIDKVILRQAPNTSPIAIEQRTYCEALQGPC